MPESTQHNTQVLERGNVYFLYRPKMDESSPEGLQDVQRFFMVMEPKQQHQQVYRLIVIGHKKMPAFRSERGERENWSFVDMISKKGEEIEREFEEETHQTKTRGQQKREPARPVGEGVYDIVLHNGHTHFAYALRLPEKIGQVQKDLALAEEGSYIISVKNPKTPSKVGFERKAPHYPRELEDRFGNRKWIALDPPSLLDYEGTQILLIGAEEDVSDDLGIEIHPEEENMNAIFDELHLAKDQQATAPLFRGKWE
jgi:hypothetical protein